MKTVFFYVQHLLGIGHQIRAMRLTKAMREKGLRVVYVSGGFSEGVLTSAKELKHDFIQLPPVRTRDASYKTLVGENGPIDDAWWDKRIDALHGAYHRVKPDLILLEMFPFGRHKFKRELLPFLTHIKKTAPKTLIVSSVRDIIVPSSKPERTQESITILQDYFDFILVHGTKSFIPLDLSFPLSATLQTKTFYTGYVAPPPFVSKDPKPSSPKQDIVVSCGGGASGATLIDACLDVCNNFLPLKAKHWHFLAGPKLPLAIKQKLAQQTGNITVENTRPDFLNLLMQAELSISQCGYNTAMDIARSQTKAIFVPFGDDQELEQPLRAKIFDDFHLAFNVPMGDALSQRLGQAVMAALKAPSPSSLKRPFSLDGAPKSANLIQRWLS